MNSCDQATTDKFVIPMLEELGVERGSNLLIHSSFKYFSSRGHRAENFIESIIKRIGENGTLAFPTLSWKEVSATQPLWSEVETKSNVGILSEIFRVEFADLRSIHPTHSVAALGPEKRFLLKDHHLDVRPCSEASPWGKLGDINATIILMGVDFDSCTLIHHLEGTRSPDCFLRPEIECYQCLSKDGILIEVKTRRHKKLNRNFYKYKDLLMQEHKLKAIQINDYQILAFTAKDLVRLVAADFDKNSQATIAKEGEQFKLM